MGPEALAQVLRPLQGIFPVEQFPQLLVGLAAADDAAVYRISDEVAVIQTVDFFTPIVDDPYDYGAIAAANAMSDVYAMGGDVILALNICAFPSSLPTSIITQILRGGADTIVEGGGVLAGGHTITDNEPKYGLSVMGLVHPEHMLTEDGARDGDLLVLTKPLGVGIVTTAAMGGAADDAHLAQAVAIMRRLNRSASGICRKLDVRGCTDITGFGLLGHGSEMAEKSNVRFCFYLDRLPFTDGALRYADECLFPGGTCRNQQYYERHIDFAAGISDEVKQLLFTPETSGGLLFSVASGKEGELLARFEEAGEKCWIVGHVIEGTGIEVR